MSRPIAIAIAALLGSNGLAATAVLLAQERAATSPGPVPQVDHHVHILGADLLRDWKALGATFSKPDAAYLSSAGLLSSDGRPAGDTALEQVVLVPMAHFYGSSEMRAGLTLDEERERVQRENDHVAAEAGRLPGRAVAACSVDFLRPYAEEEIARCRSVHGSPGIKLHLASAGADLRSDAHLTALRRILARATTDGMWVLLHFDPQARGLEVEDVRRFIDVVLGPIPDLRVCIAHLGGSGGYGEWTQSVFRTFTDWLAAEERAGRARSGMHFDISAVVLERASEGVAATTDEEVAALSRDLRRIGVERVVFGSDYPVFDPYAYARLLRDRLDLAPGQLEALLKNRFPPPTE